MERRTAAFLVVVVVISIGNCCNGWAEEAMLVGKEKMKNMAKEIREDAKEKSEKLHNWASDFYHDFKDAVKDHAVEGLPPYRGDATTTTTERLSNPASGAYKKAGEAASKAFEQASDFKNLAADKAHRTIHLATGRKDAYPDNLSEAVAGAYDVTKEKLESAADKAKEKAAEAYGEAKNGVREQYSSVKKNDEAAKNDVGEKYSSAFSNSCVGITVILLSLFKN